MIYTILLLAGDGLRLKADSPKQFISVNGKPLFSYSLDTFFKCEAIDKIVLVTKKDYIEKVVDFIASNGYISKCTVIEGGATRFLSVNNALEYLSQFADDSDYVLIHDSARPLVTTRIIEDTIRSTKRFGASTVALLTSDTTIESYGGEFEEKILERKNIYSVQTPQGFRYKNIRDAHKCAIINNKENVTDDAQLIISNNGRVALVKGDKFNFKVTTYDDLILLKAVVGMETNDGRKGK